MNAVIKTCLVNWMGLAIAQSAAAEESLAFHVSCAPVSADCIEMQLDSQPGETIAVTREPEMVISQSDLKEAEKVTGQFGEEQLQLKLKSGPAEKFGQITGNNIGKQLAFVAGGKVLIAPTIQAAITSGDMVMSVGVGSGKQYLERLPWLKKMTEDNKVEAQALSTVSIVSYIALGVLLLGGSVYFAFFRGRAVQN